MTPAQRDILAKSRRGEPITVLDKLRTMESREELAAFEAGVKRQINWTDEHQAAFDLRRRELS